MSCTRILAIFMTLSPVMMMMNGQEAAREAVAPGLPLHPELIAAMDRVGSMMSDVEAAYEDAREGKAEEAIELLKPLIDALPEECRERLKKEGADLITLLEARLTLAGSEGFTKALERARGAISPDDLLAAFSPEIILAPLTRDQFPMSYAFWEQCMKRVQDQGVEAVPHLGPYIIAYLAFGALHHPTYWSHLTKDEEEARQLREQFILEVMRKVEKHPKDRVLAEIALKSLDFPCKDVPVLSPTEEDRAKVGFTRGHLDWVKRLLADVDEARHFATEPPFIEDEDAVTGFATTMHQRILWELEGKDSPKSLTFSGPPAQVKADLEWYLEQYGAQAFWEKAQEIMAAIDSGKWPHPLDEEIAALVAKLAELPEDAPERLELEEKLTQLKHKREADQDQLYTQLLQVHVASVSSEVALEHMEEQSKTMLSSGVHLGTLNERTRSPYLSILFRSPDKAPALVMEDLARLARGEKRPLGDMAVDAAIGMCQIRPTPGAREALREIATKGYPQDRWLAMINVGTLNASDASLIVEENLRELEASMRRELEKARDWASHDFRALLTGCVHVLKQHETTERSSQLRRLLECSSLAGGDLQLSADYKKWILESLAPGDRAALEARGLLPR
ncbi:MAG: hypothetical protein AB1486_31790 [Planctomycetota bacterium]